MKRVSFILAILGLAFLLGILIFPGYVEVKGVDDLRELEINDKVVVRGFVERENVINDNFRLLEVNGITITCECGDQESYLGMEIVVKGLVEEYEGTRQIDVGRIEVL